VRASTPARAKSAVLRATVLLFFGAAVLVACGAGNANRNYRSAAGACWQDDSQCARSSDCCSLWCVNGYCSERNGP
jgi:hypothetical protein